MACSKYEYVKAYEMPDKALPNTFVVLRIDGHSFHRFSDEHNFIKPNDERALKLMDNAAQGVMQEYKDIVLAFGESDEYSFLFRRSTALYNRRQAKILSTITSLFTSLYVFHWPKYFPDIEMRYPPSFDGRIILYPSTKEVRDYFSWRQVDTHINNLYNTVFWALVQKGGQSTAEAHKTLNGTNSSDKHEMLFSRFQINYNELPERFRRGSALVREVPEPLPLDADAASVSMPGVPDGDPGEKHKASKKKLKEVVIELHVDIIKDEFWTARSSILNE